MLSAWQRPCPHCPSCLLQRPLQRRAARAHARRRCVGPTIDAARFCCLAPCVHQSTVRHARYSG
eukprot:3974553-Alexandrium_andersonii.AAC.1